MTELHLARNLVELRKEMGVTQEVLADFVGVSKASVSKWETGQSFPDIGTLPKLASYFNCSIDELMGYEAQLDRDHIRKLYFMLAEEFATKPFEEVYEKMVKWCKEYYSCYPFLHQMTILVSNHYMLTPDKSRQQEVLAYAIMLCKRICEKSQDVLLCKDSLTIWALLCMANGSPTETLRLLSGEIIPYMGQDELIAQAYQMTGNKEKALLTIQVSMYQKLASIMQMGGGYLVNASEDREKTKLIIDRIQALIDTFEWENLNPGNIMGFYYGAASILCKQQDYDGAVRLLRRYIKAARNFKEHPYLHGDSFFDQVDSWIGEFELGGKTVREKSLILASVLQMFESPELESLAGRDDFKLLKKEAENLVKGE